MNTEDHRVREIDSLNDDLQERGYQRYSRRFCHQVDQFQKFARYNTSLLIIIGTILLIILGGMFTYYFYYKDASDLLPNFITGNSDEYEEQPNVLILYNNSQTVKCSSFKDKIKLEIHSSSDCENHWTELHLGLECEEVKLIKELNLTGIISPQDLQFFHQTFRHTEKLWLSGSESLCKNFSSPGDKTVSDYLIFENLIFLSISNTTKDCDKMYQVLLQKPLKELEELHVSNAVFTPKVSELVQSVLATCKISNVSLTNLTY